MDSEFLTNREGRISYGLMDLAHISTDRKLGDREVQRKLAQIFTTKEIMDKKRTFKYVLNPIFPSTGNNWVSFTMIGPIRNVY
jgi:hypothetical protein